MFKVVMISPLPPESPGESTYTAALINKLAINENVRIIAITGPDANELPDMSGRVTTMKIWRGRDVLYPFTLLKAIAKIRPHIVHVQFGPHGAVYGGFFGEPMIVLLILLRIIGIDTTITLHSTWMTDQVENRISSYHKIGRLSILAKPIFRLFMKFLGFGTTKIQLSTTKMDSLLRRKFIHEFHLSERNVDEIPHPCATVKSHLDSTEAHHELGLQGRSVILVFGYIRRGKGIEVALKAVNIVKKEISNVLLLIAGKVQDHDSRAYLNQLKKLIKELDLQEFVRFDSYYIPEDKLPMYFSAARIILVPYTESVGASGPIHNYAGYGTPLIAADVGYHMKEALGGTLTLFKNRNPEDLADKVITLLNDNQRRKELGDIQIKYAANESWKVAAKRTMKNYERIIF
ncbi:MAG: glycosyltransferase [Candidatus Thorarchaeota archaeon]|jgi:glycosyltransferase involved in cell wall biosynthesis